MNSTSTLELIDLSEELDKELQKDADIFHNISTILGQEKALLPFQIDILGDALHTKELRETAHTRILYSLLQNQKIRTSFLGYFIPNLEFVPYSVQIPYPDKNRIDLTIKGDNFFVIIENKVNGAIEQESQINRYVQIALQSYILDDIYVLYINGETKAPPTEYSLSQELRQELDSRLICISYKEDIASWITSICKRIDYEEEPLLKSSLITYQTYLENKFNISNTYKTMSNKIHDQLQEKLDLDKLPLSKTVGTIEDSLDNMDIIVNCLNDLLVEYKNKNIREWYNQCVSVIPNNIVLTIIDDYQYLEFGFDFKYHNVGFRCCVSFDDQSIPYWGIREVDYTKNTHSRIFESLYQLIINSNKGFHNYDENGPEWVISNYSEMSEIIERFTTLTSILYNTESCCITLKDE